MSTFLQLYSISACLPTHFDLKPAPRDLNALFVPSSTTSQITHIFILLLSIRNRLMLAPVSLPYNGNLIQQPLDLPHLLLRQLRRSTILHHPPLLRRPRDRHRPLCTHPPNRHLRQCHALPPRDLRHRIHQLEILTEILRLEPRQLSPKIVLRHVVQRPDPSCQPASRHGTVRRYRNREFATGIHDPVVQRVWREQTQLDLDSSNRVHGVRAPDRGCARFAQPHAADLPFTNELTQGADGDFDGDLRVDARRLEDIDCLNAGREDGEGGGDAGADALGAAIGPGLRMVAAFDGEDDAAGVIRIKGEIVGE